MAITTNVPQPTFGPNGFVAPLESAILTGVQADIQAIFGGGLNPALNTPQGQLASSETAVIGNTNNLFLAMGNGVDPAYATGRYQDAIARIYFLERFPPQSTTVICTCTGLTGAVIPQLSLAADTDGNTYYATTSGTIDGTGSISLTFANQVTGPIPCPANTLTTISQAIAGWDTINNPSDGSLGNVVESRADFEHRRQLSVAGNSTGALPSIRGAVLGITGVTDCFPYENDYNYQGSIGPSCYITGTVDNGSTAAGTTLTVTSVISGVVATGQAISCPGILPGTLIVSGSGSSWVVNQSQYVPSLNHSDSTRMALGGVPIAANNIYVAVVGGDQTAVADAIFTKKAPGCGMTGNTSVTVYDDSTPYTAPGIPYSITFEIPTNVIIYFNVQIVNSVSVPSNAVALVQAAIISAFSGSDGGQRATIYSTILASRFYAGITGLGAWAQLISLTMGSNIVAGAAAVIATSSIADATLTVGSLSSGTVAIGQVITGTGVVEGTVITAGSGSTWTVSPGGQTVASTAMTLFPVTTTSISMTASQMPVTSPNDIYVALV
jgi:uncharacterized phage protein gp47/JayE